MPETYGKRQRRNLREQKIAAREERRVARSHRRDLRAAGLLPPEEYVAPEDLDAAVDGSENGSSDGSGDGPEDGDRPAAQKAPGDVDTA